MYALRFVYNDPSYTYAVLVESFTAALARGRAVLAAAHPAAPGEPAPQRFQIERRVRVLFASRSYEREAA